MPHLNKPATLLLVDDYTLVRAAIRALLERFMPTVSVIGEAGDGRTALELVSQCKPDLVLMDSSLPGLNGVETTVRLLRKFPRTRVILFSVHRHEEHVLQALRVGARGYLFKSAASEELRAAIQTVLGGEIYLSQGIDPESIRKRLADDPAESGPLDRLTPRQREILQLIAEGNCTKEIAFTLKLSPKTVEFHRQQLMARLGIHHVPGLVRYAIRTGLVVTEG